MDENNDNYQFVLEPIHDFSGSLIAYELLTKFSAPGGTYYFRKDEKNHSYKLSQSERLSIFRRQIALLCDLYQRNDIAPKISVNIDKDIAGEITSSCSLQEKISQMPLLRFEICEFFSSNYDNDEFLLLKKLTKICPLWLDNFGAGNSNLTLVMKGGFEYVKIEKNFFWQHGSSNAFRDLISHLNAYCEGVIVEGIEHASHEEKLRTLDITGMQGHHWDPVKVDAIRKQLH